MPDRVEIDGDPDHLIGLARHQLPGVLGAPILVRQDGPSEVWQYEAEGCVLDIYLYRPDAAADLAVVHVESRDKRGRRIGIRGCLRAVEDNLVPIPTS